MAAARQLLNSLRLVNLASAPSSPAAGQLYWDTAYVGPRLYDGAAWQALMARLTRTAVKTGNYSAAAWDLVPVDTTSAAVTVTLPTAPAHGTIVAAKFVVKGGNNNVTVATGGSDVINVAGGATSTTISLPLTMSVFFYDSSSAVWTVMHALSLPTVGSSNKDNWALLTDSTSTNGLALVRPAAVVAESHSDVAFSNSNAENDIVSFTAPGGIAAGDLLRLRVWLESSNSSGGNVTYRFKFKIGSTTVLDTGAQTMSTSANTNLHAMDILISIGALATSETVFAYINYVRGAGSWDHSNAVQPPADGYGTAAENIGGAAIKVTCQMGTAAALASITAHAATLEHIPKRT